MTELLIINRAEVEKFLTMEDAVLSMDAAMRSLSSAEVEAPQRTFTSIGAGRGHLGLMPAAALSPPVFGVKTISLLPGNPNHGRPAIQGFVALFNHETGEPIALIDGVSVTAIRTAAASALATRELARKDAQSHGILGTGVQAVSHARAILAVRPDIKHVRIWGRSSEKAEQLARQLSDELNCPVSASDLSSAIACDIVSAVTGSADPIIQASDVVKGAHINLVGSHTPDKREASSDTIRSSRLFVDLRSAALAEAGDVLIPLRGGVIKESDIIAEIGDVLLGHATGRESDSDITIYKSLGNAAQDLFAAAWLLETVMARGAGQKVKL